jgi:hypothetical protein
MFIGAWRAGSASPGQVAAIAISLASDIGRCAGTVWHRDRCRVPAWAGATSVADHARGFLSLFSPLP